MSDKSGWCLTGRHATHPLQPCTWPPCECPCHAESHAQQGVSGDSSGRMAGNERTARTLATPDGSDDHHVMREQVIA